jgi:hypothetical protein
MIASSFLLAISLLIKVAHSVKSVLVLDLFSSIAVSNARTRVKGSTGQTFFVVGSACFATQSYLRYKREYIFEFLHFQQ